ncbi:hypothetical protein [Croceicoccus bisphenolivorans]|nr:hypothetical protein [Croceicoccus bisphenolivorans]
MQNKTDRRWTKPELKTVGTLRDVANAGTGTNQTPSISNAFS